MRYTELFVAKEKKYMKSCLEVDNRSVLCHRIIIKQLESGINVMQNLMQMTVFYAQINALFQISLLILHYVQCIGLLNSSDVSLILYIFENTIKIRHNRSKSWH